MTKRGQKALSLIIAAIIMVTSFVIIGDFNKSEAASKPNPPRPYGLRLKAIHVGYYGSLYKRYRILGSWKCNPGKITSNRKVWYEYQYRHGSKSSIRTPMMSGDSPTATGFTKSEHEKSKSYSVQFRVRTVYSYRGESKKRYSSWSKWSNRIVIKSPVIKLY